MAKKHGKMMVLNVFFPIILGAIMYYFVSPEVIFVKWIDDFFGTGFHVSEECADNGGLGFFRNYFLRNYFLRNYFLDMLWGYGLVFALFLIRGNNTADLWKSFLIAFLFSAAMEMLQMTPIAKGTFDVWDIAVMFLAEVIAVFIIKCRNYGESE